MNRSQYLEYMTCKDNAYQCDKCIENRNFDDGASHNRYPCGQYNCWVVLHCKEFPDMVH